MAPTDIFSNRELAVGAWVAVFVTWTLCRRELRASLGGVVRSALAWKLSVPALLLGAYTSLVCYALWRVGIWEVTLLKDTIVWFVVSGLAMAYSFERSSERGWLRSAIASQVGIVVFIEYLATGYTFSLPAELALQPVLVAVGLLHAVSETDNKYRPVTKLTGALLSLAGLLVLGNAAYQASQALGFSASTVRSIALPVALAAAFLPAAYSLHLAVAYESLFVRLRLGGPRDKAVVRYARRQLIKALRLDVRRVRQFMKADPMALSRVRTKKDVDELLRRHREAPSAAN